MRKTLTLCGMAAAALLGVALADEAKPPHAAFDALVKKYVNEKGEVDYKSWKEKDTAALDAYLTQLSTVDESKLAYVDKLALWLNAHNAVTVRAVLEFYPIDSIKDKVSHVPLKYNLWKEYKKKIAGRDLSLDEIVNKVLRKLDEPRVHFAICWAAKGSPILRNEAYEAAKIYSQLDDQVEKFLADKKNFKLDPDDQEVCINEVFKWYGEDFGANETKQLAWLGARIKDEKTKKFVLDAKTSFEWIDFDWALNSKP